MEKIHRTLVIAPVVSMPSFATSVQVRRVFPRHRRRPRAAIGPRDVPQLTYCAFTWMQTQTLLSGVPANAGIDQNNSAVPEASDIPLGPAGQIEIPFVPAHKRQTLANPQNFELKGDTVVVVGQAGTRQRKRKRDKVRGVASVSQPKSGTSASTGDRDQEEEEFDYSSVPNLLDNESKRGDARGVHEEDERRKKKQRHGKGMSMSSPDRHAKKKTMPTPRVLLTARNPLRLHPGTRQHLLSKYLLLVPWKTMDWQISCPSTHPWFTGD